VRIKPRFPLGLVLPEHLRALVKHTSNIRNDSSRARHLVLGLSSLGVALALAACAGNDGKPQRGGRGGAGGPPPEVGFVVVQPTSVPITVQLPGRATAFESSDVRPQVSGIIRRRLFTEGSLVQAGQVLYEIDPRLYRAAVAEARANLARAEANQESARALADRYRPLVEMDAISKQDYTNAYAAFQQASAAVAQARAALETAEINLKFTTVPAPIAGRIGRSLFTVGALVSANQTQPLAQIQRLDPIFIDIQESSTNLLILRRSLGLENVETTRADVRLTLEDGSSYTYPGSVEFSEALVNPSTGTVTLRARFPNPQGILLPGMFVRASFSQSVHKRAFLVPQVAVSRDVKGNATVYLVGPGNRAVEQQIRAEQTQDQYWVVTEGLNPGDRVIVQGISKISPNRAIVPVAANSPERVGPPGGGPGRNRAKASLAEQ